MGGQDTTALAGAGLERARGGLRAVRTAGGMRTVGYVRFRLVGGDDSAPDRARLRALAVEFDDLPPDPYGEGRHRYRRYARAVLIPWSRSLEWLPEGRDESGAPVAEYFQGDYNPEFRSARRRFPPVTEAAKANPLLHDMIWCDYEQTFWDERDEGLPLHVGVHFVRLLVEQPGHQAVSSPDHLHQDGEPFTFAHLVRRRNALGGRNTIAVPACSGLRPRDVSRALIVDEFELRTPLESYGVCDAKVSHYVDAVSRGPGPEPGERSVVLVDFTSMVPRL